jgi:hypothetical protein
VRDDLDGLSQVFATALLVETFQKTLPVVRLEYLLRSSSMKRS